MNFNNNQYKVSINSLVVITILILLGNLAISYVITNKKQQHSKVINIAGRQRMLVQKMTKESILLVHGIKSNIKINETINEFETNLSHLIDGNPSLNIPPIESKDILQQQLKVRKLWGEFKNNLLASIDEKGSNNKRQVYMNYILETNETLLQEVNIAVSMYEEDASQITLFKYQSLIFLIGFLTILGVRFILQKVIHKMSKDTLTNIYTRDTFTQELVREMELVDRYGGDLGLIMFDIDYFKYVNDTYGHSVGDEVLIELTKLIKDAIRNVDLFARWGGEEFMIIAPQTNLKEAYQLAERLRTTIDTYCFKRINDLSCSFGVTTYSTEDSLNDLIKKVDSALYRAKETGRNKVVIYSYTKIPKKYYSDKSRK